MTPSRSARLTSFSRARFTSLASVGKVMFFGCTVVSTMTRLRSDGFIAPARGQALLQQGLEALLAHAVAPAGDRGAIERQGAPEELLAAEILIIRVLDPPCAHHFVAEIEGVLENGKAGHQLGRKWWAAGAVGVHRAELLFQEAPVDRPRKLRQFVIQVDDLVEPCAEQIRSAAVPPFPWSHRIPRSRGLTSTLSAALHGRLNSLPRVTYERDRDQFGTPPSLVSSDRS